MRFVNFEVYWMTLANTPIFRQIYKNYHDYHVLICWKLSIIGYRPDVTDRSAQASSVRFKSDDNVININAIR